MNLLLRLQLLTVEGRFRASARPARSPRAFPPERPAGSQRLRGGPGGGRPGRPGRGGSLRPGPGAPGRVPRPHGVEEETPRESEVDQRVRTDSQGPGPSASGCVPMGALLRSPVCPASRPPAGNSVHSKYRPVSPKCGFRTCGPDAAAGRV